MSTRNKIPSLEPQPGRPSMAGARGGTAPLAHRARKRFGQHFLHDPTVLENIVAAIGPGADDRLVEIGPGRGALTRLLLEAGNGSLDAL
ncbi:MAG TPA: rRNA adenine N-6-methyltransferase family protein, partial [Steroidobacteraceae bacterium]|nr:rRNA adenine N-6-methyltransferase family protein [Steroidobacteraceae bacterium]